MGGLAARAYFLVCLPIAWLLRSVRYSRARVVADRGERRVRKHRLFYAPLLVRLGDPLVSILNTGVRVLAQREWVERERVVYQRLRGTAIRVDDDGTLVLPYLRGQTLAALLGDRSLREPARSHAIALAAAALGDLHRLGFTHGDAMAENVLVDLEAGAAHWFDFETIHDSRRTIAWRRADDVRALLATGLARTAPGTFAETLRIVLDAYADREVESVLAASFTSVLQRPLAFHLAQARLSFRDYREIARLLSARISADAARP